MDNSNISEMVEKLKATRTDFVRTLVACVANADSYLANALNDGVISLDFENMFNGATFYLSKIKEIDFSLARLSVESKSLDK